MMDFYDNEYIFEKDYSTILNYDENRLINIPSDFKDKTYHSLKNVDNLLSEPILECGYLNNSFDKNKQKIIDYYVHQKLKSHTIMLTHRINGIYEGVASSVYISYNKKLYIITAGHTFSDYKKEIYLYLFSSHYSLENCKGIIYPPCKKDDFFTLDYAIIYIDSKLEEMLKENGFIPFDISNSLINNQNGIYNFYYGFPASYNKANKYKKFIPKSICFELDFDADLLELDTLKAINDKNPGIDYLDTSYNNYKGKLISTEDIGTKNIYNMPDLHGMSGCGIWRFKDYPFDAEIYYLEGIFLGGFSSKLCFDKITSIIKYWELVKIPERKILNESKMITLLPKKIVC